ncbi:DUF1127 domain-containing protein [Dongia sp.]|uniref:DUF1127 domain-containing protein n=1 Tax=Dongia sp. TaxID=1977262 RepID=UPI0035B06571
MFASNTRSARSTAHGSLLQAVGTHFRDMAETWRQRRHLANLSDGQLRDIGLTRADVAAETNRPFWKL